MSNELIISSVKCILNLISSAKCFFLFLIKNIVSEMSFELRILSAKSRTMFLHSEFRHRNGFNKEYCQRNVFELKTVDSNMSFER